MDRKFIIIGAILVVLMVAFGNNPTKAPKQSGPTDPFRRSLEKSLSKSNTTLESMGTGTDTGTAGGAPTGFLGNVLPNTSNQMPSMSGPMGAQTAQPTPPGQLVLPGTNPADPRAVPLTSTGQPPGSYPPPGAQLQRNPFENQGDWVLEQQMAGTLLPQGQVPTFFLADGRRIFFSGLKSFVLSSDGNLTPLPDGTYPMRGGSRLIIVNGERQADQ